jgi:hypothetical protein
MINNCVLKGRFKILTQDDIEFNENNKEKTKSYKSRNSKKSKKTNKTSTVKSNAFY